MRWFWIDRYTEFESGRSATAVKNVSLAEEHLHDHFPGAPIMPNTLIIEGIAQTGGLLVAEHSGFNERVVLAKVAKARFHLPATPGDTLTYRVTIDDIQKDGAIVSATSHIGANGHAGANSHAGERLQAEVQLFFAHLSEATAGKSLFDPASLLAMVKLLGVFDVGRDADGQPLALPKALTTPEASN
jgi:3-hydroxyacyl-[acyl-carrier-protein] dehydratase